MIRKFISIKNVGKFKNYSAMGNVSLDKVNIIYGENSTGKTTLASIIRSLILNKPELISERKTFRANDEQYAEILFENNRLFKFQNIDWNDWNDNLKNIEVFDEFFINENILTGMDILSEHQKYLYEFAMGEEGVTLSKDIEKIKNNLQSDKYPKLSSLKDQIQLLTDEYLEVEQFVELTEDEEIEKKIKEKKQEINVAEASNEIRKNQVLDESLTLSLPLNLPSLKNLLEKSLTTISEKSLQKTKKHINELYSVLQKEAEPWLHQGLLYVDNIIDSRCPFCQRDLKGAEIIIESYRQYFNEEYKKVKEDINEYSEKIKEFNIEVLLNEIKSVHLNNKTLIEFWKRFLSSAKIPELKDLEQYFKEIAKFFKDVKLLIESKLRNILEPVSTDSIDKLSESLEKINENIDAYNQDIRNFNEKIKELKSKYPDIEKLRDELRKLEIQKDRFSIKNNDLCDKYQECKNDIERLKDQVKINKENLNEAISQKVEKYGEETNRILEKFGAPFKIVKQTHRYRGRGEEPYFEYFLEIEGCEVNPLQKAKFTLSGGDRNALALSFFLAKIDVDENINSKIIIFDDPISSFDINRKRRTIEFIRDLSKNAKQIIILTHLNTFAFELNDSLKDIGIKSKCFQIINGNIKEWDINEEKKHPFFKNLSKIETFINEKERINLDEARRLIRICLEDKLKFGYFQFFRDFGEDCWLGPMVDELRNLKNDPKLKFKYPNKDEVINELGNLCDFSAPSHHSNITTPYKTDYTQTEIVNYLESTLKLIYEWL